MVKINQDDGKNHELREFDIFMEKETSKTKKYLQRPTYLNNPAKRFKILDIKPKG